MFHQVTMQIFNVGLIIMLTMDMNFHLEFYKYSNSNKIIGAVFEKTVEKNEKRQE